MRAYDDSHFDASGPVGQYWLTNGVGFIVCHADGRKLGAVVHVVVDRRRQVAERLIVRRAGLLRRPRYVAIDPRAVESVSPDSRLFTVPAAQDATPATPRPAGPRVRASAASARTTALAAARASGPVLAAVDRRLAVSVGAALRISRRGAKTVAHAAVRASQRARRDAPRLEAWLAARASEARSLGSTFVRFLGRAAGSTGRLLGELGVLAAVLVVTAWRRTAARWQQPGGEPRAPGLEPPAAEPREWRRDADAPMARERRGESSRRSDRRARR